MVCKRDKHEDGQESTAMIQARGDGGLGWGMCGEKQQDSVRILKIRLTGCAFELDVGLERKRDREILKVLKAKVSFGKRGGFFWPDAYEAA